MASCAATNWSRAAMSRSPPSPRTSASGVSEFRVRRRVVRRRPERHFGRLTTAPHTMRPTPVSLRGGTARRVDDAGPVRGARRGRRRRDRSPRSPHQCAGNWWIANRGDDDGFMTSLTSESTKPAGSPVTAASTAVVECSASTPDRGRCNASTRRIGWYPPARRSADPSSGVRSHEFPQRSSSAGLRLLLCGLNPEHRLAELHEPRPLDRGDEVEDGDLCRVGQGQERIRRCSGRRRRCRRRGRCRCRGRGRWRCRSLESCDQLDPPQVGP